MLQVSEKEIENRLEFDNLWWGAPGIESRFAAYPRRFYFQPFYQLISDRTVNRAVILMGPRRVGKTVMVYHAVQELINQGVRPQNILYLSLETPLYTGLTLEKILGFFQKKFDHHRTSGLYIFFDEIQYFVEWEVHLKSLVDSYPSYKFIATGSAAAALRLKSRESGAGRFTDFLLPPLTFAEYLSFIGKDDLVYPEATDHHTTEYRTTNIESLNGEFVNYLNFGGYPEAVFSETIKKESARYIKSDIIDKVLLRDLPSLYGISDIQELNRLFTTLAYNTGNEITLEELSQSANVAKNTLKRYLEYLEAAFLIKRVYRIDFNAKAFRRATSFKVYLTNPSMRAALFGYVNVDSDAMGALTETAIFSQWLHSEIIDRLYYARWKSGEVDIVYVAPDTQKPAWVVEVKWSDNPVRDKRLLKNVVEFTKKNQTDDEILVLVTTKTQNQHVSIDGIGIELKVSSEYAYTVGKNILSAHLTGVLLP